MVSVTVLSYLALFNYGFSRTKTVCPVGGPGSPKCQPALSGDSLSRPGHYRLGPKILPCRLRTSSPRLTRSSLEGESPLASNINGQYLWAIHLDVAKGREQDSPGFVYNFGVRSSKIYRSHPAHDPPDQAISSQSRRSLLHLLESGQASYYVVGEFAIGLPHF